LEKPSLKFVTIKVNNLGGNFCSCPSYELLRRILKKKGSDEEVTGNRIYLPRRTLEVRIPDLQKGGEDDWG